MNILFDELPEAVEIDGKEYAINYDFKSCIKAIMAFEDKELTDNEKYQVLLQVIYPVVPENIEQALLIAIKFLDGGKSEQRQEEGQETQERRLSLRLYSFSKDASFIYSAIQQTHGIDITKENLHWWKFLALFNSLSEETFFCKLTNLRRAYKTGKASEEEIKAAHELGEIFDIEDLDTRTDEEKQDAENFMKLWNGE